jgi:hypothetical protein
MLNLEIIEKGRSKRQATTPHKIINVVLGSLCKAMERMIITITMRSDAVRLI